MERRNYLYLAHSKLRFCSFGPALRTGELPKHLVGTSRLRRDGQIIWEKSFCRVKTICAIAWQIWNITILSINNS